MSKIKSKFKRVIRLLRDYVWIEARSCKLHKSFYTFVSLSLCLWSVSNIFAIRLSQISPIFLLSGGI